MLPTFLVSDVMAKKTDFNKKNNKKKGGQRSSPGRRMTPDILLKYTRSKSSKAAKSTH